MNVVVAYSKDAPDRRRRLTQELLRLFQQGRDLLHQDLQMDENESANEFIKSTQSYIVAAQMPRLLFPFTITADLLQHQYYFLSLHYHCPFTSTPMLFSFSSLSLPIYFNTNAIFFLFTIIAHLLQHQFYFLSLHYYSNTAIFSSLFPISSSFLLSFPFTIF